jgi:hypothetical protein
VYFDFLWVLENTTQYGIKRKQRSKRGRTVDLSTCLMEVFKSQCLKMTDFFRREYLPSPSLVEKSTCD